MNLGSDFVYTVEELVDTLNRLFPTREEKEKATVKIGKGKNIGATVIMQNEEEVLICQ